jgi:hypothetical protein
VISSHEPSVLASHPGVTIGRSRSRNLASFNELAEAAYLKACVSPFSAPHETLRNNRFPVLTSLFSTAKGATLRLFFKATERVVVSPIRCSYTSKTHSRSLKSIFSDSELSKAVVPSFTCQLPYTCGHHGHHAAGQLPSLCAMPPVYRPDESRANARS